MSLGTLDRNPPPLFKQGPSAFSKLIFFSSLCFLLMVADARFRLMQPIRSVLSTVLYPVQWLVLQPVQGWQRGAQFFDSLESAKNAENQARVQLASQSLKASQVELLIQENARLRELMQLSKRLDTSSQAAQVLYDAADPFTRRIIIDRGQLQGIELGSPVLDESGVLGQVTRIYPMLSEVTLIIDRDHAIPVLNVRTGARSVAYGDPLNGTGGLELRFMSGNSDVQEGDLLTTSGVDGVYLPGLPVAKISKIERRADSAFARIACEPLALVSAARHVVVLKPIGTQLPARPATEAPVVTSSQRKGRK